VNITFNVSLEDLERACKVFDKRRLLLVTSCNSEQQAARDHRERAAVVRVGVRYVVPT